MRPICIVRRTLGIVVSLAIVQVIGTPRRAVAQANVPTVCAYVDAAAVGILFLLDTAVTPDGFARQRESRGKGGRFKVESVSGVGDDAYYWWDSDKGDKQSVGIVFRLGRKKITIGDDVPSDSIEAMKNVLVSIAKTVVSRVK